MSSILRAGVEPRVLSQARPMACQPRLTLRRDKRQDKELPLGVGVGDTEAILTAKQNKECFYRGRALSSLCSKLSPFSVSPQVL